VKRKSYRENTPEPKDLYGDSDLSDDRSPSSWAIAGRDDNDLYYWEEVPKEAKPKDQDGKGELDGGGDHDDGDDPDGDGDDDPFDEHPMCCAACHHVILDLFASIKECVQATRIIRQHIKDLERVVDDDFKFFNHNVRKLFGMHSVHKKKKWCLLCGKFH
jgi:hypothetical protein